MDRCKAKEKLKYVDKLHAEPRSRYMSKLTLLNGFDPYDLAKKDWSQDANMLPPLLFGDMVNYLDFGRSAYTWDEFKSYKSLEVHNQFTNGWVHERNIFSPDNCDNTVIKAKVRVLLCVEMRSVQTCIHHHKRWLCFQLCSPSHSDHHKAHPPLSRSA